MPWWRTARNAGQRAAALASLLMGASALPALRAQPANDCLDPAWADTLRCQNADDPLTLVPQPIPPEPTVLRDFTRVDLPFDPAIRCLDGTLPVLYVDPAKGGPSDDWILSFTGGGSCSAGPDGFGGLADGQECLDTYRGGEGGEMGTAFEPAMKNLGAGSGGSEGLMSPDLSGNPVFARFHRVRVEKCSFDRHNGRSQRPVFASHPVHGVISYQLYQHGQKIARAAIDALRDGLVYDTFVDQGGSVVRVQTSLPPLRDAGRVLLVGHSGAALGLLYTADRLRETIDQPPFAGDIRVVIDEHFLPSLENEADFTTPAPSGDLYDHVTSGSSPAVAPTTGVYDAWWWQDPSSDHRLTYQAWSAVDDPAVDVFDGSCVAAHPGEEWRCADYMHTVFNHVTTPAFVREDLSDPNVSHTNGGAGHLAFWGEWGAYAHCPGTTCPPLITVAEHQDRLRLQQGRFAGGRGTRSELVSSFLLPGQGLPADPSSGGTAPSLYLWMPDCARHAGSYDEASYQQTLLVRPGESATMRSLLEEFVLAAPASGAVETWVDGIAGAVSLCAPAVGSGSTPDGGAVSGTPLTVSQAAGSTLELSWGASCIASDSDFAVYEGALGDFSSHVPVTCSTGGATSVVHVPPAGSTYYLVVPRSAEGEGSYGRDSQGVERGQGSLACLPQRVASCGP